MTSEPFTWSWVLEICDRAGDAFSRALSSSLFLAAIFIIGAVCIAAAVLVPITWGMP